jgi:hypothetical protein
VLGNVVAVFNYLNNDRARRWINTANDIHTIMGEADTQWNADNPSDQINLQAWVCASNFLFRLPYPALIT